MKIIRLLTVVLLALIFCLPANPVMAESLPVFRAVPALVFGPADGSWTGTTNLGKSMSFSVQSGGAQWSTFKLTTSYTNGGCSVTLTTTVPGPGSIVNGQFSWTGSSFAFTGNFTSASTASGTYTYTNQSTGCGTFSQSGTWTASVQPVFVPADGSWTGTTNLGKSMSFSVQSGGAQWNTFELTTSYTNGGCSVTITTTMPGPGSIVNGQFSSTGLHFAFTGNFTSEFTASGTYTYTNQSTGCGTFSQSGTWTASVPPPVPAAFEKSTPINGASSQPLSLNLSWGSSTWATAYEYCYDTLNNNICDGSWIDNGTSLSAFISGLNVGATYYWQVKAKNSSGTVYADGDETAWWSFTTVNLPGDFNKSSPTDGATDQSLSPTLTWGASNEAASYEYCYDTTNDNTCTGWASNGASTNKALSGLSNGTTYYWHVRAVNAGGTTYSDGVDTTFWSFTTRSQLSVRSTGAQDGWILETGENTNKGGTLDSISNTLRLGDDSAKKQYRSILSFATGATLPDNAVITKVTLKVKKQGITGGGNPVTTFQGFVVDIKKGFFGTTALQASDFQAKANKSYGPFKPALSGGWYSLDLTSGKDYINKLSTLSGLTQIRLRFKLDDNNNAKANYLSLFSGNAPLASRPQLIIEYYVP